jgi:hypothetical protein
MMHLEHIADLRVTVADPIEIGSTPAGQRRVIPITGGEVKGPRLQGRVLPAGADFQLIRNDGVAELEAKYVIQTHDNARIYVTNRGLRHGPADAMRKLQRGEAVDPALIYFRSSPQFETAAAEYNWLTKHVFVAEGARHPDYVLLSVYQVM